MEDDFDGVAGGCVWDGSVVETACRLRFLRPAAGMFGGLLLPACGLVDEFGSKGIGPMIFPLTWMWFLFILH